MFTSLGNRGMCTQYWLVRDSDPLVAKCFDEKLYIRNKKYGLPHIAQDGRTLMMFTVW